MPGEAPSPLPLRERDRVRGDILDKGGSMRRMRALIRKEMLQILRDPSSLVVAVVLPLILLSLFGFGVSFDVTKMRVGVVIENPNPETEMFVASLANTPFFQVRVAHDRRAFLEDLTASRIEGVAVRVFRYSGRSDARTGPYSTLNPDRRRISGHETPGAPSWGTMIFW